MVDVLKIFIDLACPEGKIADRTDVDRAIKYATENGLLNAEVTSLIFDLFSS